MQEARPDLKVRAYIPALTSDRNFGVGEKDIDWTGEVRCLPDRLGDPLKWSKPRRVFVNSMSDLFHVGVPIEFIEEVFLTMVEAERHTFQVLTKRSQRMRDLMQEWSEEPAPANVWLGVSVESAKYRFRLDHLRATPAAVRWVSFEPLLGPVGDLDLTGIDWAVVGGESGRGARPMHPDWAREIRDQCIEQGVAFFFKQWGNWRPGRAEIVTEDKCCYVDPQSEVSSKQFMVRERSKNFDGHDLLDGQQWHQYPQPKRKQP